MPTVTSGTFFISRDRPARPAVSAGSGPDGAFTLTMRVVDNQGPRRLELYVVRWTGEAARQWWARNVPLEAGDALSLRLVNPRSFVTYSVPEIQADVTHCERLPRYAPARSQGAAEARA